MVALAAEHRLFRHGWATLVAPLLPLQARALGRTANRLPMALRRLSRPTTRPSLRQRTRNASPVLATTSRDLLVRVAVIERTWAEPSRSTFQDPPGALARLPNAWGPLGEPARGFSVS